MRKRIMARYEGFTLLEAMVVLAIISLISIMTVPNLLDWRRGANLRGAASNLKADLEMTKLRAIQENAHVAVVFYEDRYEVFVDDGAGTDGVPEDLNRNGIERLIRNRQLPAGVSIDLDETGFTNVGDKTRFDGKGIPLAGSAALINSSGERRFIIVSPVGRIRISKTKS